jgi:hemerythrin-like metal-binding protein
MTTLAWSPEIILNHAQLDSTHQEFVEQLNAFGDILDRGEDGLPAFRALLAHTEEHFAMEERWMAQCGFDDQNCHTRQHAAVLNVMREVVRYAVELKDLEPLAIARTELAVWFPNHAQTMDAGLAHTMKELGFDPDTGVCAVPREQAPQDLAPCHTPESACATQASV